MIVTRTPLRISFAGGGSDIPWFSQEEDGAVVSAAIDKYVYVTVSPKFDGTIRAAYARTENVARVADVQHELIREALHYLAITSVEMHSIADIPAGTGLGSSSSFTVGLLHALDAWDDPGHATPRWLAEKACLIEIERCAHPIGKQDQYAAAFGGLNLLRFTAGGVAVEPVSCDLDALSSHLLLLYTGSARQGDAGEQIAGQRQDRESVRALAAMAPEFAYALRQGDYRWCGDMLDDAWRIKRRFCADAQIDAWYQAALAAGAWGGKLCGAGGGGFLCFLAPPDAHADIARATGLRAVPVRLGVGGSEVVWAQR